MPCQTHAESSVQDHAALIQIFSNLLVSLLHYDFLEIFLPFLTTSAQPCKQIFKPAATRGNQPLLSDSQLRFQTGWLQPDSLTSLALAAAAAALRKLIFYVLMSAGCSPAACPSAACVILQP